MLFSIATDSLRVVSDFPSQPMELVLANPRPQFYKRGKLSIGKLKLDEFELRLYVPDLDCHESFMQTWMLHSIKL